MRQSATFNVHTENKCGNFRAQLSFILLCIMLTTKFNQEFRIK